MFSKIQKSLPNKNWKTALAFSPGSTQPKPKKDIPKISDKKKARLKEHWTEAELFKTIWNTRPHVCKVCAKPIPEPKPECFSHVLSKWRYPEHRYNPFNIALVCSIDCHSLHDQCNAWNDAIILKYLWDTNTKSTHFLPSEAIETLGTKKPKIITRKWTSSERRSAKTKKE